MIQLAASATKQSFREKVYPDNIRNKVWTLLLESYQGCPSQFAQAFLSSPQHHLLKFLTAISQSNLTCASKFSEICDLVVAIQQGNPHSLQDLLTLDSFCIIITPELRALPFNPLSCWLIQFADNEAKRADHSGMAQWTPSARATCLLDFIATGDRAAKHIRTIIDQTCTLIRWFSDTESFVSDISQVFACAPSLAISHTIHPALPFFQMAFHLACLSPEACEVFVEMDILQLISRTWLRSFPDPRNCPAHRQFQMQNDMRVVCLLMIGAISRHFPSSEEVANHLLHIHAESEDQGCPISDMNSSAETIAGNCIQLPVFPPESCVVTSSIFLGIPPLSLFVIEACVKNGIYIPCSANSSSISPWAQVLDVFSWVFL